MNRLRFTLLGPVRAWRDGAELDLGSPQQRATLAVLLLRESALTTLDDLLGALWGDEPPPSAVGTVRTYVSRLRQVLGRSVIDSTPGGYALRIAPDSSDLAQLARLQAEAQTAREQAAAPAVTVGLLRRALGLYEGVPLAGFSTVYADGWRDHLLQAKLAMAEEKIGLELHLGRHNETIQELVAMVTEHPLRESLRELLMLALYRSGRQAEALDWYRLGERLLGEELGVDPGPGLRSMYRRIIDADPTLVGPRERGRPGSPWAGPTRLPPGSAAPFPGRAAGGRPCGGWWWTTYTRSPRCGISW
jgi:DNA-binding SARP family transcriptional activator